MMAGAHKTEAMSAKIHSTSSVLDVWLYDGTFRTSCRKQRRRRQPSPRWLPPSTDTASTSSTRAAQAQDSTHLQVLSLQRNPNGAPAVRLFLIELGTHEAAKNSEVSKVLQASLSVPLEVTKGEQLG